MSEWNKNKLYEGKTIWGLSLVGMAFIGTPIGMLTLLGLPVTVITWVLWWVGIGIVDIVFNKWVFKTGNPHNFTEE